MEQYCNKLVDCLSNFVKLQERLSRLAMIFKLKAQYNLEIGNIYIMFFYIFLILNNKWATKIGTGLGNPNLGAGSGYGIDHFDLSLLHPPSLLLSRCHICLFWRKEIFVTLMVSLSLFCNVNMFNYILT